MTNAEFGMLSETVFYVYLTLLLVNYAWFLPKAYREFKSKRPTHATRNVKWACGLGVLLSILLCVGMATPWRAGIYFLLFILNGFSYVIAGHLWMRHQILSNPDHPLHGLYSSMIMK
jgi:hypothetical protein